MKLKRLFVALALATVGALASAIGIEKSANKQAEPAEAVDTYSGSVIIQKNDDDMKWTGSKIVGYLYNDSKNAWGEAVWNDGKKYQEYSWSNLSFNPTKIIILRVHDNWESTWGNPWYNPYCRTGGIDINDLEVIYMAGNASWDDNQQSGSGYGTYYVDAVVKGGASDSWSDATVNERLTKLKISSSNSLEVYGEVELPANTYFKVVKTGSEWCGSYTADSLISGNLSGGGENNIHNTAKAKYEFYFDYEGKTTYITDPARAAADEWSQYFLSHVGCDDNGVNLPSGWSDCETEYGKLSDDAKDIIYSSTAKEDGTFVQQAVARYDYAIDSHPSLSKFIKNSSGTSRALVRNTTTSISNEVSNNAAMPIVVVMTLTLGAASGIFFLRKKRKI